MGLIDFINKFKKNISIFIEIKKTFIMQYNISLFLV